MNCLNHTIPYNQSQDESEICIRKSFQKMCSSLSVAVENHSNIPSVAAAVLWIFFAYTATEHSGRLITSALTILLFMQEYSHVSVMLSWCFCGKVVI